jgi:hypothetical protein
MNSAHQRSGENNPEPERSEWFWVSQLINNAVNEDRRRNITIRDDPSLIFEIKSLGNLFSQEAPTGGGRQGLVPRCFFVA